MPALLAVCLAGGGALAQDPAEIIGGESPANGLLVGALNAWRAVPADAPDATRLEALQDLVDTFGRIRTDHPSSWLAVQLATGQPIGTFDPVSIVQEYDTLLARFCQDRVDPRCTAFMEDLLAQRRQLETQLETSAAQVASAQTVMQAYQAELRQVAAARAEAEQRLQGALADATALQDRLAEVQRAAEQQAAEAGATLDGAQQDFAAQLTTRDGRIAELEQAVQAATGRAAEIERQRQALDGRLQDSIREVAALNDEAARAAERLALAQSRLESFELQIASRDETIQRLQEQVAAAEAAIPVNAIGQAVIARLRPEFADRSDATLEAESLTISSDSLFVPGTAELSSDGRAQLAVVAEGLLEIAGRQPPGSTWRVRVGAHTDRRPINTPAFPSNWQLSLARANAVVQFLVGEGVAPERLSATGYAEFQPLDAGETPDALRRNRRIELVVEG